MLWKQLTNLMRKMTAVNFLWNILDILTIMRAIRYLGIMCKVKIYIMELYKLVKIKVPIFDTFFTILIKFKSTSSQKNLY